MKRLPLTMLLPLLVACTEASSSRHTFQMVVEEGVPTAISSTRPKYDQPLFIYEEILELKQDPENEESLLYRPRSFTQDEDGTFYVIDYGNSRIAVFDAEGDFVRGIGRSGEGPGEFQRVSSLYAREGILQAFDMRSLRVTRFRTEGTLLDVHTLAPVVSDRELGYLTSAHVTADGGLVLIGQLDDTNEKGSRAARKIVVLDQEGKPAWDAVTPFHQTQIWAMYRGVPALGLPIPFATWPSATYEPGHGVLISPGDEPVLLLRDLEGQLRLRIRIEMEPRPVSAEDKTSLIEDYDRRIAEASERTVEQLTAMRDGLVFPEFHPYWTGGSLDDSGFIWLGKSESLAEREAAGGGYPSMVLSPEGEYLGDTRRPVSGAITHGRLLARITDEETGEERLVVFAIRPAVEGLVYP